jgi:pilus assembly protein Flp/PilA
LRVECVGLLRYTYDIGSSKLSESAAPAPQGSDQMLLAYIRGRCFIQKRLEREDGQALVEYALIISLIAVVAIAAVTLVGTNVKGLLSNIATGI